MVLAVPKMKSVFQVGGVAFLSVVASAQQLVKAREAEFSLVPPFQAEDNQRWETGAGARVETQFVRLTPALPGRTG